MHVYVRLACNFHYLPSFFNKILLIIALCCEFTYGRLLNVHCQNVGRYF